MTSRWAINPSVRRKTCGQISAVTGGYVGAPEDAAGMEIDVRVKSV
jgi:hypothetical protein